MPTYIVGQTFYFRSTGKKLRPGDQVHLSEEDATEINVQHPGAIKMDRIKAVGAPEKAERVPETAQEVMCVEKKGETRRRSRAK
jgi:hypothetical protein